jgi:hypothetical protein
MIRLSQDHSKIFLACDACGKSVALSEALLAGPFADASHTQPDDAILLLIHGSCIGTAHRILGPTLLESFSAVRAQPLLQPLFEKTDT